MKDCSLDQSVLLLVLKCWYAIDKVCLWWKFGLLKRILTLPKIVFHNYYAYSYKISFTIREKRHSSSFADLSVGNYGLTGIQSCAVESFYCISKKSTSIQHTDICCKELSFENLILVYDICQRSRLTELLLSSNIKT